MAINKYTKPVEHRVQSTQVLPRTEILAGALANKQAKYDKTLESLKSAHGAISGYSVVGDAAKADLEGLEGILLEKADELLKKDLSDPNVSAEVNSLISELGSDSKLKTHLVAKENYNKYIDQYRDLSKKGKIHESSIYFQDLAWKQYKKTGEFNADILGDPIIPEAIDVVAERKKLVDMLKASGSESIKYLADGTAYKTGAKGVDAQRVLRAVDDQLNTYALGAAGQQEQRDYLMKVHQGAINPEKLDFANYLRQQVWSTAQNYVHMDYSTNVDGAVNSSNKAKKEKEDTTFPMATGSFKSKLSTRYSDNIEFKGDGSIVGEGKSFSEIYSEKGFFGALQGVFTDTTMTTKDEYKYAPIIAGAKLSGVTPKEYYEKTKLEGGVEYNMFTKDSDASNWGKILLDGGAGNIANLEIVTQDGVKQSGKAAISKMIGNGDMSMLEVSRALADGKANVKVLGFSKPSEHAAYGMVVSVNGQNAIVDLSHLLKTNAIKPDQKYKIYSDHARATANAGIPTPTTILNDKGKPVDGVVYKNVNTNKIEFITNEEAAKKLK
jgi:hypothetical protein